MVRKYSKHNTHVSFKTDDNEKPLQTGTDEQKLAMAKMIRNGKKMLNK